MGNTYTQIHLQLIFAVKYRAALIAPSWKLELYKYISKIITENKHKLIIINGVPDHLHILIGMRPHQALSKLLQEIKGDSSKWINDSCKTERHFNWQDGFGAFSYSKSDLPNVINYIKNQEQHHKKISFIEEYKEFLDRFEVDYDERYLLGHPE
ncbi:MAG: IS200/IS605 family transposase [Chitinophagales bacterium]